jgi:hypothetical protein
MEKMHQKDLQNKDNLLEKELAKKSEELKKLSESHSESLAKREHELGKTANEMMAKLNGKIVINFFFSSFYIKNNHF